MSHLVASSVPLRLAFKVNKKQLQIAATELT
jgi:hypothetical protein